MQAAEQNQGKRFSIALLILFLAAAVRFYRVDIPFVETYNSLSRQSICASVAKNFYAGGFHFFNPEINENGRGPYLFQAEMPFGPYLMALGYKIAGGVREGVARSVSIFFSLGTILLLYLLAKRWYGEQAGLAAAAFAAFSPLNLALSRSVQPEAAILFGITGAVYFYVVYLEEQKTRAFWLSGLSASFVVASKFYNAFILLPLALESILREGGRFFGRWKNFGYAVLALVPLVWYFFMWKAEQGGQLAYCIFRYLHNVPGVPGYEIEIFNWSLIMQRLVIVIGGHLLTPLGALLFVAGITSHRPSAGNRLLVMWLGSMTLMIVLGWKLSVQHSYYVLPLLPPAAVYIGKGWAAMVEGGAWKKPIMAALLLLLGFGSIAACVHLYPGLYFIPERRAAIVETGRAADTLLPKDALVVASFETSPIQLYYCGRKGWSFPLNRPDAKLIEELESRKSGGAKFFVISNPGDLSAVPVFENYLQTHFSLLKAEAAYRIYRLTGASN